MAISVPEEHRRALVILIAGLGLVGVIFVGSRLVAGGDAGDGGDTGDAAPVVTTTTAAAVLPGTPGPAADEEVPPIPELPDSFEILELRDPFESPLLVAAVERLTPAPTPAPAPAPDGGEQRVGGSAPGAAVTLTAIEADDGVPVAAGTVSGAAFRAAEGERFGPQDGFEVVDIDTGDRCVLFRQGDEPFTLCVGRGVVVK
jgi:hypothetical protein